VPLLESHPAEAAATNVLGTRNLVPGCPRRRRRHFVFVSTDKAVEPANVMGASKRLGEQLVLAHAPDDSSWCAVRFGNVLGSRGSVVPTFMRQIREGGPVTLTHPDMTRFFMSIPEAVQLVLQAAALADDRQIFMLDMGEAVRIADLAQRMISLAGLRVGVDIQLEVTGLRPGEKITEELYTLDESPSGTEHPKIFQLRPRLRSLEDLQQLAEQLRCCLEVFDDEQIRQLLLDGVPAPVPPRSVGRQRHPASAWRPTRVGSGGRCWTSLRPRSGPDRRHLRFADARTPPRALGTLGPDPLPPAEVDGSVGGDRGRCKWGPRCCCGSRGR
jgi:FlaA1/EpsC-like NDP-sugar epimerase